MANGLIDFVIKVISYRFANTYTIQLLRYYLLCEGCSLCTRSLVIQAQTQLHKRVWYYEYIRVLQLYYVRSPVPHTLYSLYTLIIAPFNRNLH